MKNEIKKENKVVVNPPPVVAPAAKSTGMLTGIIIGVLLCTTAVLGYTVISKARKVKLEEKPVASTMSKVVPTSISQVTVSPIVKPSIEPLNTVSPSEFGEIIWLEKEKKIEKIKILKAYDPNNPTEYDLENVDFYQVANFSKGSQLIYGLIPVGMGGRDIVRMIITPDKQYVVISNKTDSIEEIKPLMSPSVKFTELKIEGIEAPEKLTKDNLRFKSGGGLRTFFSEIAKAQKIFDSDYGPFYKTNQPFYETGPGSSDDNKNLFTKRYLLKLKDNMVESYYTEIPFLTDDKVPKIKWNDGTDNKTTYARPMRGCVGFGDDQYIEPAAILDEMKETGKTSSGEAVYEINNPQNWLVKYLYHDYKVGREYPSAPPIISIDEFAKKHNHFLWKDPTGDWQIFASDDFAPMAECGKPVIYLYPEKETMVNVQVGAEIRKSEPEYAKKGWTVLAKPNGELVYQGQKYSYLFWEGLGKGVYPDYRNRGTVVKQEDLAESVEEQLGQLGLNKKETTDFMEFWQERLPKTPYARLTWLMTEEMDKLAPLKVSPRPESYIRVFLEFEGLEKPVKLMPQELVAPERKGFTLVEWGGLLVSPK